MMLFSLRTVLLASGSLSSRSFLSKTSWSSRFPLAFASFSQQISTSDSDPVVCAEGRCVWLVVGDGDLSYSANLARTVSGDHKIQLVATVLEKERAHQHIYRNSIVNSEGIVQNGGRLQFGVDATKLETLFAEKSIRRIIFNFPHWRGKSNIKHNRNLLNTFLCSASKVLEVNEDSEIHIALCEGQGGADAATIEAWKSLSWMVPAFAAAHGLLLRRIERFRPSYDLSSHRGTDRSFLVGANPQVYVFGQPNGIAVKKEFQVAYRHELRLVLDPEKLRSKHLTEHDLLSGSLVDEVVQTCVPFGIAYQLASKEIIRPVQHMHPLLVILVVYTGEKVGISREIADEIRAKLDNQAEEKLGLNITKRGRLVSKAFPYRLLREALVPQ